MINRTQMDFTFANRAEGRLQNVGLLHLVPTFYMAMQTVVIPKGRHPWCDYHCVAHWMDFRVRNFRSTSNLRTASLVCKKQPVWLCQCSKVKFHLRTYFLCVSSDILQCHATWKFLSLNLRVYHPVMCPVSNVNTWHLEHKIKNLQIWHCVECQKHL